MKVDRFISVVAPFHNGGAYLSTFTEELVSVLRNTCHDFEVVFIDNGSTDNSSEVLAGVLKKFPGLRVIVLSRFNGEAVAISVGLSTAIGDYTIVLDPLSDPPALIPQLIERALKGADIVYGIDKTGRARNGVGGLLSSVFHWYVHHFLDIEVPRYLTSLRCLSRHAVNALTRISDAHSYYRFFGSVIGFKSEVFDYSSAPRSSYSSHTTLRKAISEGIGIIVENSPHPLRVVSLVALSVATANLFYIGYIVLIYLFKSNVMEGWTTLSMQISVLFMCVILILAAISEYTGKILQKLQGRPAFFVKEERKSAVMITAPRLNVAQESENVDMRGEIR